MDKVECPRCPRPRLAPQEAATTLRGVSWKVLITARTLNEVGQSALAVLREAGCELTLPPRFGPYAAEELLPLLGDHQAVLASMDRFTAGVLMSSHAAQLKIISRWGVGYDAIDIPAATAQGIIVAYTPGLLSETVADFAFALLLSLARRVHISHASMSQGKWEAVWGTDVFGKTLGILGCGRIGHAMARRAAGFNMRLLAHDIRCEPKTDEPSIQYVSLDELLAESDFLSLHAALSPENRGLISEAQLRRMKRTAYLINTARGALIDETALARALNEKWIAGAALDTFTVEPLPAAHPLRGAANLLLTPHLASFARETGERVSLTAAQAIVDLMQGRKPQFVVDPSVYNSSKLRARLK